MVAPSVTPEFQEPPGGDLLLTRLAPPAHRARLLRRQRVETLLSTALEFPLSLVVAPAGSGKTVALTALAEHGGWPAAWCRARHGDTPALLIRHLAAAFRPIAPLDEARIAAALARAPADPRPAIETLVNELAATLDDDTLLVLDDYHLIDASPALRAVLEEFLAIQPLRLHLALASRVEPVLAAAESFRLRGELLVIEAAELAFDLAEARALFEQPALAATGEPPAALATLVSETRGWPIALQAAIGADDWRAAVGLRGPSPIDAYVAQEVLAELPDGLHRFLLATAALRRLDPALCALLLDGEDPGPHLAELQRRRLFLDHDEAVPRLQPIFHACLERRAQRALAAWPELHRRAAAFFRLAGDAEGRIYHLLKAGDEGGAVEAVIELAPALLAASRPERVLDWVRRLPLHLRDHPRLLELRAAALRQLGSYDEALQAEAAAERVYAANGDLDGQVRTLRGLAEVYLDTVQPAHATELLKRAFKLLPRERAAERANLLRMQAENWANRGRADVALILERAARGLEAEQAQGQAGSGAGGLRGRRAQGQAGSGTGGHASQDLTLSPARPHALPNPGPPPRLLLRAGRLSEARAQLEAQLWGEGALPGQLRPGVHREPLLLLALVYVLLGGGPRALAVARRGLAESQQLGSRITEAIAQLRLGHAYQLVAPGDPAAALQRYEEGMRLIQSVGVARTRAEGLLGLTLLHGHAGDMQRAEDEAQEGLQIAEAAGDEWTAALILLALGGAAVAAGDTRALGWLEQARQRFARGGDSYGQTVVILWHALHALRAGDGPAADAAIAQLLERVTQLEYAGLLMAPSLFGPRDLASLVPLLLRGRALPGQGEIARQLLRAGFPTIAADDTVEDYHPGFTLRVQLLGSFRIWRGQQEIQAREWQREKARQLIQLLITQRGHWVQREQICALLWPDADLDAAERQFKVTLNALNAALEPARPPRVAPFFIRRQGLAYSFAPSYGVWIDVDEFELRASAGAAGDDPEFTRRNAQIAVQLYKGDYLAEALYDPWTTEERERLLARYLVVAVGYAERLSQEGDQAQAVQICEQVLRRDRGYEEAYQTLMRAHARAGSRSQALRSYTRCRQALQDELGMEPLPETVALYERLRRNEPI